MGTILQDLRFGWRMLARNPGFTAIAIITLALGIGANTAIFSVVRAVLLAPLPYQDPGQLVLIWETEPSGPGNLYPASGPDFVDWRKQNRAFESIAAATGDGAILSGQTAPLQLMGADVSPEMFHVLGIEPLMGRTFTQDETEPGRHVVILSYGLWQSAFGGEKDIVGRKIRMNGTSYDVVGVMPQSLKFPPIWVNKPQFWMPLALRDAKWKESRGNHWLWVLARRKNGVTLGKARAEMETVSGRLEHQYPDTNTGVIAKVMTLRHELTKTVGPALLVLFAAVGFLLLIACANVANLLLTKAVARQREIAVRLAVGSGRLRLVRQLLTESVLLFILGGVAGLMVGNIAMQLLVHAAPTGYIPSIVQVHLDGWVFGFTFLVAFITGALAGLIPAIQSSKPDLHEALKEGGRTIASPQRRSRTALTVAEIALALVVLVGAGLALRSLVRLLGIDAGFNPKNVLTARVSLPHASYPKDEQVAAFYERFVEHVRALPGVKSAALSNNLPLEGGGNGVVYIEGQPLPKNMWSSPLVEWRDITPGYFHTLGIPLLKGRDFNLQDTAKSLKVAVINQNMAHRFWPNQDAVGKRFSQGYNKHPEWITVVGVVGDVREYGLAAPPGPGAYFPETQSTSNGMVLVVRTSVEPLSEVSAVTGALHQLDSQIPLSQVRPLTEIVTESSGQQRFVALLLALFAIVALVLAAIGIYGVISYSVAQRTHEIGIRMALGAQKGDVLRMIVRQGITLSLIGVGAGLVAAFALTRMMVSLLYEVKPWDPVTFVAVAVVLIAVALLASYIPARRAAKVDPMVALRYE